MVNTQKTPIVSLKLNPPKPQAANAPSAPKGNLTSQTKITKPAVKAIGNSQLLQMSQPWTSSHGGKDTDTLALLERIALLQGVFIYFWLSIIQLPFV